MGIVAESTGLIKRYRKHEVLKGVDFTLNKGEIVGLLGENGAGKSTLMKLVVNLLKRNHGTLKLFDQDPSKSWYRIYKDIRILLEPKYPPYLTGREFLIETAILQRVNRSEVDQLLKKVGLEKVKRKKIKEYSFGMQQRLGLAASLLGKPKVLILDEPFVGLDPTGVIEIQHLLIELSRNGTTILISSHQLDELKLIVDRILYLHQGKIQTEISREEFLRSVETRIKTSDNQKAMILLSSRLPEETVRVEDDMLIIKSADFGFPEVLDFLMENDIRILSVETRNFDLRSLFGGGVQ